MRVFIAVSLQLQIFKTDKVRIHISVLIHNDCHALDHKGLKRNKIYNQDIVITIDFTSVFILQLISELRK